MNFGYWFVIYEPGCQFFWIGLDDCLQNDVANFNLAFDEEFDGTNLF
jgi:hypothetical protein